MRTDEFRNYITSALAMLDAGVVPVTTEAAQATEPELVYYVLLADRLSTSWEWGDAVREPAREMIRVWRTIQ